MTVTTSSCTVNPAQDAVDDSLGSIITAKAVTNVKASTTEVGLVTLTFDGQKDADDKNLYYQINYQLFDGANPISTKKSHVLRPSSGQTSFSYTMPSVPAGVHVLFSVDTVIQYGVHGAVNASHASSSALVEGAALPGVELSSPVVNGNTVSLYWDDRNLMSALDQTGTTPLYGNYKFQVQRLTSSDDAAPTDWTNAVLAHEGKATSFTERVSGNEVHLWYRVNLVLMDAYGVALEGVPVASSSAMEVSTDASTAPAEPLSLSATQGTRKDGILVSWTLPDFVKGVSSDTASHRVKIERAVADSDDWDPVLLPLTDINTSEYQYAPEGTGGKASYSWLDATAKPNTIYSYRIAACYYFPETKVIQMQDTSLGLPETEHEGYLTWLPTNLQVSDGRSSNQDPTMANTISWTYDEPKQGGGTFQLSRSDEYATTIFPDLTGTSYTDTFTLSDADAKMDHSYSYSLRYCYPDGSMSEAIVSNTVTYQTTSKQIAYIEDLRATSNLAGKVVLTWKEHAEEAYEHDKLTYSLQSASSYEELSSAPVQTLVDVVEGYEGMYCLPAEARDTYYKLIASYGGTEDVNASYVQVVQGSALAVPSGLHVEDGTSQMELQGSFEKVPAASSYKIGYRVHGGGDAYTYLDLAQPGGESQTVPFSLSREVGAGTTEAGRVYDFVVVAVDETGEETESSPVEQGSLFGPYGMDAAIGDNDTTNNSFTVTWNAVGGANGYNVNLYRKVLDGEGKPLFDATTYLGSKLVETLDGAASYHLQFLSSDATLFAAKANNPYPLSCRYLVKVVPYRNSDEEVPEELIAGIEGHWFAPPVLEASHATSGTQIVVTWNEVEGAEHYLLYRSSDGMAWDAGTEVRATSATFSTTADTYFTIASVRGGLTSQRQVYGSEDESNHGYVFKAPASFNATSNADKPYYTLVWSAVDDATGYYLKQNDSEPVLIDVSSLGAGESTGNPNRAGYLSRSADGKTYGLLYQGEEIVDPSRYLQQFAIKSYRKKENGDEISSEWSTNTHNVYRLFDTREILDALATLLKTHLQAANTQFKGDWWPNWAGTSLEEHTHNNYSAENGAVTIVSAGSIGVSGTQKAGSITFQSVPVGSSGITISTTISPAVKAQGGGAAGYLGIDPLGTIEKGSFTVSLPSDPFEGRSATVEIVDALDVQAKTGTLRVTFEGETVDYAYGDLTVKPY